MTPGPEGGDRSKAWHDAYRRVRKTAISSSEDTNRRRLAVVCPPSVGTGGRWLDLGAGDGNLVPLLIEYGASQVVAVDYQLDLLRDSPRAADRVVGSATELPLGAQTVDVAVVMDVFHHLEYRALTSAVQELHRVLRPHGLLFVFEPANTFVRRILTPVLKSPLGSVARFTRDKQTMVRNEEETLIPWLRSEHHFSGLMGDAGFRVEIERRYSLHQAWRFRSVMPMGITPYR